MKRLSCKISIFLLLIALFCSLDSFSQDLKNQDRKAEKEARKSIDYQNLGLLLNTRKIMYETERVQASTGAKVYNVVQVDGSRFYIRCENPQNTSGSLSGVRDNTTPNISPTTGTFFDGIVKDWQLTGNDKDRLFTLKFNVLTKTGGPYGEVFLKAFSDKSAHIEIKDVAGNMIYSNYTGFVRAF
jgi:hypothetical protein